VSPPPPNLISARIVFILIHLFPLLKETGSRDEL
jgi:hypothetical protein